MAQAGWNVAATSRTPEALASWADQHYVLMLRLDADDEATIKSAIEATLDRFAGVDVLINNSGYGLFGPLEGVTHEQLASYFRGNLLGALTLIWTAVRRSCR